MLALSAPVPRTHDGLPDLGLRLAACKRASNPLAGTAFPVNSYM